MRKIICYVLAAFITVTGLAQTKPVVNAPAPQTIARPKLVIGIVIDQMRWDYLYRYYNIYKPTGGFKRLMNDGFSCDNTMIPYTPTVTAVGHSCVYTGAVPAISGITGNDWYDNLQRKMVYCTDDTSASTVGSTTEAAGKMSPRNLLVTTIGDELKLATNFESKVIGIALKDRASILPAGHSADGAYWYDLKTGDFITSTYYNSSLPEWVKTFNQRKLADSLYGLNWDILLPADVYKKYSTEDYSIYENKPLKDTSVFPYDLTRYIGKDYSKIEATPYGNTITLEMVKAAVAGEALGSGENTDFLTVSFSSPDYIGHSFGPNSWEQLDDYARLDETLGKMLDYLDATVGKNQYTVFLTADHGVAHLAGLMKEHGLPAGTFSTGNAVKEMNAQLKDKYGKDRIIRGIVNYQVVLNNDLLDSTEYLNRNDIINWVVNYLQKQEAVARVFPLVELANTVLNSKQKEMITNGYYPTRSGDIQLILKPGYYDGGAVGTTHGLWNPYDAHIPLLFYGWGIKHGKLNRETYMTDISATVAALLHIQMPSGCVGHVIEDVIK